MSTFWTFFATFAAFVPGVVLVADFINKLFKVPSKPDAKFMSPRQIVALVTSVVLACVGFACQLGFFADFGAINTWQGWVMTIITGIGAGFAADGIYDINAVWELLQFIFKWLKPKTKTINE